MFILEQRRALVARLRSLSARGRSVPLSGLVASRENTLQREPSPVRARGNMKCFSDSCRVNGNSPEGKEPKAEKVLQSRRCRRRRRASETSMNSLFPGDNIKLASPLAQGDTQNCSNEAVMEHVCNEQTQLVGTFKIRYKFERLKNKNPYPKYYKNHTHVPLVLGFF